LKPLRFVLAMAARESRASAPRLALLMAAVAVGVAALVAINSFTDNLQASVRAEARALLGADLAFSSGVRFSERGEALIAEAREAAARGRKGSVVEARVTSFSAMAYVTRTGGARLVQVAAVSPGYPFYGVVQTDPAAEWGRLEETGGALVDRSLLAALGAEVGDSLALGESRFQIRGVVVNVPGEVGIRAAFGPRVFIPARRLDDTKLLAFGSRGRYEAFFKVPADATPQVLAERFRSPLNVERITVRTVAEDQRRLNETLANLGRYLGLVGLVALFLGGIGVASAAHVFIKRKIETVAVLRCLGASGRTVLFVYLLQAAGIGLVGGLAGALLGLAVQMALPRVLGDFLPVEVHISPSLPAIALGVGLGLWIATAFALVPLLAVRHVSPLVVLRRPFEEDTPRPRDRGRLLVLALLAASLVGLAILQVHRVVPGLVFAAGIGVALALLWLAAFLLARGVRRFFPRRLPYLWRQGLANLYRPANQTVTVVLALGFGAFLLSTLVLVHHNLLRDFSIEVAPAERPNLVLFDIQKDQRTTVEQLVKAAGFEPAAPVPVVPMRIASVKGKPVAELLARKGTAEEVRDRWALRREYRSTYRDELVSSEKLVAGRFWSPGEWKQRTDGGPVPISVSDALAQELELKLDDEVVWDVQGVRVASRVTSLRDVTWARFEPNFFVVFPDGPLEEAPQMFVTLTRVDDAQARGALQRQLAEALPNVTAIDLSQVQQAVETILGRVALAIRFMAFFSLAAGAVVLLGAVAASRGQRVREGVLLRTLGATRRQVLRILVAEYVSLGAMASAAAILLSVAAGWALLRFLFEAHFAFPVAWLAGLAAGVVALTVIVGLWNSTEAFRRTPLEVLRTE
jgi:putative ABC transport system permease protein